VNMPKMDGTTFQRGRNTVGLPSSRRSSC
jgi:hypothetical protein